MGEMSELGWITAIQVVLIVCANGASSAAPAETRFKWNTASVNQVEWSRASLTLSHYK